MSVATITTKGQVTIPKAIRESLKLDTGDRIEFIIASDGEARIRPVSKKVDDVFGRLHKAGRKAVSTEEMDTAISEKFKTEAL